MPEVILVALFAMLVFLPCFAAIAGLRLQSFALPELSDVAFAPPRPLGRASAPVCALGLERPVTEKFEIRSFAKGLSAKRRELIRDGAATVVHVAERAVEVAIDLAEAVADMPEATEIYPRTTRRYAMLAMLEAKEEGDAWMAQAAAARERLAALREERWTGADHAVRVHGVTVEIHEATIAAVEAYRRLARLESRLQGRPDAEMPDAIRTEQPGQQTLAA